MSEQPDEFKPSRRDVLRPVEYVGGAALAAVFVGVIALVTTREFPLAVVAAGGAFIVVLVVLALLAMGGTPDAAETAELADPDAQKGPDAGPDARPPAH